MVTLTNESVGRRVRRVRRSYVEVFIRNDDHTGALVTAGVHAKGEKEITFRAIVAEFGVRKYVNDELSSGICKTTNGLVGKIFPDASYLRVRSRARDGSGTALSVASLEPPKSLFDRPSPIVSKLRHDMRLQKYRGLPRSTIPNVPGLKPYFLPKVTPDPEFVPDWMIHEDYTLLRVSNRSVFWFGECKASRC